MFRNTGAGAALARGLFFGALIAPSGSFASDYGTTGLIDTPTARVAADGTFTTTTAFDGRHQQYALTYQITPWLEGTFRYTGFERFFHWDRNYEVKARLWTEGEWLPQVAVGIRDVVGTGVFGAEYVVASKRFGGLDLTLGLGWGGLAGDGDFRNPLIELDEGFETRDVDVGVGGEVSYGQFFAGPEVGVFGGASYTFTRWPITAMVEYNPDQYDFDVSNGQPAPKSGWSYGLSWKALPGVTLGVSRQHGEDIGFSVQAALDTMADPPRRRAPKFVSSLDLPEAELPPQIKRGNWYDRLLYDTERSGLWLVAGKLSAGGTSAELIVGNRDYPLWSDAIEQMTVLADLHLPPRVKTAHLIIEEHGHRTAAVTVLLPSRAHTDNRVALERHRRIGPGRDIAEPRNNTSFRTGKVAFEGNLDTRFQLFDPDDPARYQVYLNLGAEYRFNNYLSLNAGYGVNLYNNFDESLREDSDSVLPRVRTDIVKYLNEGETGIDVLSLESRNTLAGNIHYRVFAGILEQMYSGVGGEALYWPTGSRLAVGVSVTYAQQRDFDKDFDHLDYSVTTGFVSAYWETPFYDYDVAVHAGRYLAKDVGATLEVRRTFNNGWQIGVWATRTDVSAEDFGEGSFDKGLFFRVPLDGILSRNTRSAFATHMRPIQRDGGQRLEQHAGTVYWDLKDASYRALQPRGSNPR